MGVLDSAVDPIIARGIKRQTGVGLAWTTRPAGSTNVANLSTAASQTGWGFYAGTPSGSFNRIQFPFKCTQAGYIATSALLRIKDTNSSGTLLASVQAAVTCRINEESFLEFSLPTTITTAQPIWIELFTNGRIQIYNILTSGAAVIFPTPTYPTTGYSTGINTSSPAALTNAVSQYLLLLQAFLDDGSDSTVSVASPLAGSIASGSWLSRVATFQPGLIEIASVGTASFSTNVAASTYSGHGCYIGNQATSFNGINVLLWPFDSAHVPTLGICRIRQMPANSGTWGSTNPASWNIIAESPVINLGLTYGVWGSVVFPLNKSVSGHIWFEILTNGYTGLSGTTGSVGSPTVAAPPNYHYTTVGTLFPPVAWTAAVTHQTLFCRVGNCDYSGGKVVIGTEIAAQVSASSTSSNPVVYIALPTNASNVLPALEGRELSVYFDNIIWSNVPLDQLCIDVTCTKGTQWGRCWRYTPVSADAGSTTLTVAVYTKDRATLLASAAATLKTVALSNPVSPVTRKILMIGDSTWANGLCAAELFNLFVGDGTFTLTMVGSNTGTQYDSTSTLRTVSTEAISGWTFNMMTTDTTTAWTQLSGASRTGSPFSFSSVFNFASYLSAQSITMASNDWVMINLGINDISNFTDDATANTQIAIMIGQLASWITSIKAAVSGVRIGVCVTIPPAFSQDAFGYNYGCGQTRARYIRNLKLWRDAVLTAYDTSTVSNVYVIPYHVNLDTENNFATSAVAVNARNSSTYTQQQDAKHPNAYGYAQLADTLRSFLKNKE